tara:strand:- start:1497 stop:1931 length:435 start_codon:yes stop_codon:yes gene_type:complete
MNWMNLIESLVVFIPIFSLSFIALSYIKEDIFEYEDDTNDWDLVVGETFEGFWILFIFGVSIFGAYISWGEVFDNGVPFLLGFILGGILTTLVPIILLFLWNFILIAFDDFLENKKKYVEYLKTFQVLIGLLVIAFVIYLVGGA